MSLNFDTDILTQAIKTIQKVVAGTGNTLVSFQVLNSDTVKVSSFNKGTGIGINVPCRIGKEDKDKCFSVEPVALLSLLANRKDISLTIKSSTILIKANAYEAELLTTSVDIDEVLPEDLKSKEKTKLSQDAIAFISQALLGLDLKPMLNVDTFMPVAIRITDKGAKAICYDNFHLAFTSDRKVTGDLDVVLPYSTLTLLSREFGGSSFSLVVTESSLYAYNKTYEMAIVLPQQDSQNKIPKDAAFQIITDMKKMDTVVVTLATDDLKTLATNMEAIFKKGEYVEFSAEKSSVKATLKSNHGKVSSQLRGSSTQKIKFQTGFAFIKDAISKLPDTKVEFHLVPNKMLFFTKNSFTYMLALFEDSNSSTEE